MKDPLYIRMRQLFCPLILPTCLAICFSACSQASKSERQTADTDSAGLEYPCEIRHAKCFAVENLGQAKRIFVLDPIKKDTLARYLLVSRSEPVDSSLIRPSDNALIRVPARRLVMLSSTFVGGLIELDSRELLLGGTGIKRYYDPEILERVEAGLVEEVGQAMSVNYERVIALRPELVMHDYLASGESLPDFKQLGIASVQNVDWQELSLLGRAEWIKFIGLIIGKGKEADSLFNQIERDYNKVLAELKASQEGLKKPKALFGQDFKGVWYLPSSDSYVAEMLRSAGAEYKGSSSSNRSQPLSVEEIFAKNHDADFWFSWNSAGVANLQEFLKQNQLYKQFKAFREKKVFVNDKRSTPEGGNDYWESAPYHPERLLIDLKGIFYPDSINNPNTAVYWRQLQ